MTHRNYDIPELRRLDVAHHLPAQQNHRMMEEIGGSRIITRAEGCTIYRRRRHADSRRHGGPVVRAGRLWPRGTGARRIRSDAGAALLQHLLQDGVAADGDAGGQDCRELLGGDLSHVFFNNSGSEAIDTIIRMVRYYWQIKGQPDRNIIIARENGYHGSTIGGVSLGGMKSMREQGGPLVPGFEHVMQPYPFGEGFGEDPEAFAKRAADAIEERILAVGPERVAAVVGEPVQGAGGVIIPPPSYWPRVEAICRKYGVLLVIDEVICGFGRLGKWFGFQHFGVKPDLVVDGQGACPPAICRFRRSASRAISSRRCAASTRISCMASPIRAIRPSAAVALKNLEIIEREDLVRRTAEETGPYLARGMAELAKHPLVGEARSLGLIGAVEIVSRKGTNERFADGDGSAAIEVRDLCIENGLMVRAVRDSMVMSPPLTISLAEIDKLLGIIRYALDLAEPALREAEAAKARQHAAV